MMILSLKLNDYHWNRLLIFLFNRIKKRIEYILTVLTLALLFKNIVMILSLKLNDYYLNRDC